MPIIGPARERAYAARGSRPAPRTIGSNEHASLTPDTVVPAARCELERDGIVKLRGRRGGVGARLETPDEVPFAIGIRAGLAPRDS